MLTKLEVLERFLQYVIENREGHDCREMNACHCGSLLMSTNLYSREVVFNLNFEEYVIRERGSGSSGWYRYAFQVFKNNHCGVTNMPFTKVVEQLLSYGFTLEELINLEHLQDKRFIDLNINSKKIEEVENLIIYLNNWINYEKQLVKASTKSTDTVKVAVTGL